MALVFLASAGPACAGGPDPVGAAVQRGHDALLLHGHLRPAWGDDAYRRAGRSWGPGAPDPDTQPEAYAAAFRERYGLHPAP
jgi:hypothetical protein